MREKKEMTDCERVIFMARTQGANTEADLEAEKVVVAACEQGDTEVARKILALAADVIIDGDPLPRVIELYLADALRKIGAGKDPAEALHLNSHHRKKLPPHELMNLFCYIETQKKRGVTARAAMKRYSGIMGLRFGATEKRYAQAKELVGTKFKRYREFATLYENAYRPASTSSMMQILSGTATPYTDDLMDEIIGVLGLLKKG